MELMYMNRSHVKAVAELEKICFSDPWSENSVASELDNPLSCWLICMDGETLAGYIGSQTVMQEADMMNIAVKPEYRRQGVAQQLVDGLVSELKKRGANCLTLEVRASNEPAKALYEKLGFSKAGLRPRYYQHPREDALILRKEWKL